MTLSGNNPYQGATHIAAGVLNAVKTTSVFSLGNQSALTVDAGANLNLLVQTPAGLAGLAGTYYSTAPNNPDGHPSSRLFPP